MWHYLIWSSLNVLLRVKWFFLFLVGLGITSAAFAQNLTPDPKAPVSKRPSVVAAPNGVPLVDIAKPNSKGLSHNLFREFSVGTKGAILNNSRQEAARSVLGGIVPGNPNLKNGAANVILNEVTGVSRSQLRGYLEVHGQKADVIVANPNGITCNGCGFINTPRATLTTGIPEIDGNGNLTGFKVEKGDVTFGTLGANFSNVDIVDVLSRKIFINGRIDAKTLRLIAGHNRVKYNDVENPTSLSTSTSSEIVIDSSLLGGMYVERLSIIANNKGTGVRMRGDMASSVGDVSLRADGSIRLGRASSARKLTIRSASKDIVGKRLSAKGALSVVGKKAISLETVSSDATINIESQLDGVTLADVSALRHITISGLNDLVLGLVEGNQNVTLTSSAGDINITNESYSAGNSLIVAKKTITANRILSDQNATVVANGDLLIHSLQALNNLELVISGTLEGTGAGNLIEAGNNLTITTGSLDVNRVFSGNVTDITATGDVTVTQLLGVNRLIAVGKKLTLGQALSNGTLALSAIDLLKADQVQSSQNIILAAGSLDITTAYADTTLTATTTSGDLKIKDAQSTGDMALTANNGAIKLNQALSEGKIILDAKTAISAIDQPGLIESDGDLIIQTGSLDINRLYSGNVTDVTATGDVTVSELIGVNGLVASGHNLTLGNTLSNGALFLTATNRLIAELVDSSQNVNLTAGSLDITTAYADTTLSATTTSGDLKIKDAQSTGDMALTANNGAIKLNQALSEGKIILDAKTAISAIDQPGLIESDGDLIIQTGSLDINRLYSGNVTDVTATGDVTVSELIGENGLVAQGNNLILGKALSLGALSLSAANQLTADEVNSASNVTLMAGMINIGSAYSDGFLTATAKTGNLYITDAYAIGALNLISEQAGVTGADFSSESTINISGKTGIAASGEIISLGTLTLISSSGDINATNIKSVGLATIEAHNLFVVGDVVSDDGLDITTQARTSIDGEIVANTNDVKITAGTSIDYGKLSAGRDAILTSGAGDVSLENDTAVGRNLEIIATGATIDWSNEVYNIRAANQVRITATNADLSGGTFSFGDVLFSISNNLDLSDASLASDTASAADITVNTKSLAHTASSELVAGGNLYLSLSRSFTNKMVIGAFGDTVMKVAGNLTNIDTGLIGAANHVGLFVTGTLTNKDGAALWATTGDLIIAGSDAGITQLAGGGFLLPGDLNSLVKNVKVLNSSGVIEAGRDIVIATGEFENKRTSFALKTTDILGEKRFSSTTAERKNPFGDRPIHSDDLNRLLTFCNWCEFPDVPPPPPFGTSGKIAGVDFLFLQNPDSIVERSDYLGGTVGGPHIPSQNLSQDDFLFVASAYNPTGLPFTLPNTLEWARIGVKEQGIDESNSTPEARLHAGRNLSIITSGDITNKHSLITANNNIHLEGGNLENTGANFSKSIFLDTGFTNRTAVITMLFSGWNATEFTNGTFTRLYESSGGVIREVPGGSDQLFLRSTLATENGGISGKIAAGGVLTGDFRGKIDNTTIAEGVTPGNVGFSGSLGLQRTVAQLATLSKQPLNLSAGEKHLSTLDNIGQLAGGAALFNGPQQLVVGKPDTTSSSKTNNRIIRSDSDSRNLHQTPGQHSFLFETRAPFIDVSKFYGGNYFLDRIGYYSNQSHISDNGWGYLGNKTGAPSTTLPKYGAIGAYNDGRGYRPDSQVTFLGDAFFETRLVEQTVLNKTGKRLLDDAYQSSTTQLKTLIENGAQTQKDLNLRFGVSLTNDQINALNKDIVWYVERVINGKKVLVPEVFLAHRTTFDLANDGAVIQGKQVNLTSRDDITNRGGRISSDESLRLESKKGTITLAAVSKRKDLGAGRVREWLGRRAKFSAGGDLTLLAGKNINVEGSTIGAGADLVMGAKRDVTIKSRSLTNTDLKYGRKRYRGEAWRTDHVLSDITAGGDATILAESGNLAIEGARLSIEGSGDLTAGKDITIAAVQSEQGFDVRHKRGFNKENQTLTNENFVATGKDLTIRSGKDTKIKASDVIAGGKQEGDLNIIAGGEVTIESGEDVYDRDTYSKKKGLLSSKESRLTIHDEQTVSSRVGATGDVNIIAQKDVNIKASQLDAGKDLRIAAGTKLDENNQLTSSGKDANVNITTNREDDSFYKYEKKSGIGGSISKGSAFFGYRKEKHEINTKTQTHELATLSAGKNVIITATRDIDADAPLIAANDNIELAAGRDVNIKSVQDLFDHHEYHKVSQFGVTVSVFENVTSSFKALTDFNTGKGGSGAKAISTVSASLRAIDAVNTLTGGHLAGVNIGVGFSSSKSTLDQIYLTAKGGVLQAGQDIKIDAGRDITTQGTVIIANNNVKLDAGRDLNLQAAKSTSKEKSSEKSTSVGAGITVGVGISGIGLSANFQGSKSKANSEGESTSYLNTKIIAGRSADLTSGRDTILKGARVEAESIIAKIGRDLTIESLQNTSQFKSSSKGGSFGLSANLGGWSSGINITPDNLLSGGTINGDSGIYGPGGSSWNIGINGSKGKGDYAWVEEQSGLVGEKRVDVTVGSNTDLIGGIIASKSKDLTLDTGTLTYSDLQDRDKSKQVGGSISIGGPLSGDGDKSGNPTDTNFTVEGQYAKKDKEGITRATVGEGEIIIRDKEKQKELEDSGKTQKLANINRDLDLAQEVTKDEVTEFGVYLSDSSIKTAVKAVEVVGKSIEQAFVAITEAIAETEKLSPQEAKALRDVAQEVVNNPEAREQLIACAGQKSSLDGLIFEWLISPAYAASPCIVDTPNGSIRLDAEKAKKLLQLLRGGAGAIAEFAFASTSVTVAALASVFLIASTGGTAEFDGATNRVVLDDGSVLKVTQGASGRKQATLTSPDGQTLTLVFDANGPISGVRNGQSLAASALGAAWTVVHNAPSTNQIEQKIKKGQAPKNIKRADKGKVKGEQDHIHLEDGSALNKDGSWKHGGRDLTNKEKDWLADNGWNLPE